jgi:hypothetical protein
MTFHGFARSHKLQGLGGAKNCEKELAARVGRFKRDNLVR